MSQIIGITVHINQADGSGSTCMMLIKLKYH